MPITNKDLQWIYEGFCETDHDYHEWFIAQTLSRHPDLKDNFKDMLLKSWYRGNDTKLTDEECLKQIEDFIRYCCGEDS